MATEMTTRAPKTSWCWFCRRAINHDDYEARRVIAGGSDEWVCGPCWDKADVGPDVRLDMTEGDDDDD